jgi:hypothetical protein
MNIITSLVFLSATFTVLVSFQFFSLWFSIVFILWINILAIDCYIVLSLALEKHFWITLMTENPKQYVEPKSHMGNI